MAAPKAKPKLTPKGRRTAGGKSAPGRQALRPSTRPAEPEGRVTVLTRPTAGVRVTEDNALTLSPVWRAINFIAGGLSSLPCRVHRRRPGGGSDIDHGNSADWCLYLQANDEVPAVNFLEAMFGWAPGWGNSYAEIERDMAGRVRALWQLEPERVDVARVRSTGRVVYDVSNFTERNTALDADDVFHMRGLGDGLAGISVVRAAAQSLGTAMAGERYAGEFWANDATPGGVLESPKALSPAAMKNMADSWHQLHGPGRRRRVAILEEGTKWQQTGLPPEDCQFVDSRRFSVTEIARWFNVPPHKIGDLSRSSFNNIEQEELSAVIDCLMPWARRFEAEANVKLFGRNQRGALFVKFNFNARLRGDTAARWQSYTQGYDRGVYSINDILELEDRNPIGPDGDKRFVPLNMQLLEKAGEEPPPEPSRPAPPAGEESDAESDADEERPGPARAMAPVFEDALRRCLRREAGHARRAPQKASAEELKSWLAGVAAGQREYVAEALHAPFLALAAALGVPEGARAEAALAVDIFARWCEGELLRLGQEAIDAGRLEGAAAAWEAERAGPYAERALSRLRLALLVAKGGEP